MQDFTPPELPLGEYEHYKGKRYRVVGVGRHTETDEFFVVYTPLYETAGHQPDYWLRPYVMFTGTIDVDGKSMPRFKKVSDHT